MKLILENRKQNQLKEKLFYVGILTIITVVLWVGLSIYFSYSKTSIDQKMLELTKPLNPSLDNGVLIEYESTRVPAPEEFQITTIIQNKDDNNPTIKIINPFNLQTASNSAATNQ
jgi:hypothetical protein